MCTILFRAVVVVSLLAAALSPAPVAAQEHVFLKINNPAEMTPYGPGANCVVAGFLKLPNAKNDERSLLLRVRLYRPGEKEFVIAQEAGSMVNKPVKGSDVVPFQENLKLPDGDGTYLLRVDCIDLNIKDSPKSLVASQSLFLKIRKRPAVAGQ